MHLSRTAKLLITAAGVALLLLSHLKTLDAHGLSVTEQGLSRALVTFGVSRGLNGVISVVQGTEVAVEPVGIGMTFTPGQILDPVNDLVERFSTIVLVAGTAFGLQRVALEVTAANAYLWLTSIVVLLALILLWVRKGIAPWLKTLVMRAAVVLLIVRFSVPIMAVAGEGFYQAFLEPQFAESTAQLKQTSDQLGEIQAATEKGAEVGAEPSLLDSARRWVASASSSLDVKQHIEDFRQSAETISEHAIRLMVVFVFQTIVLPLLSLWLIVRLLQNAVRLPTPD